jgi:putative addiction module component (TIGR02574 family)
MTTLKAEIARLTLAERIQLVEDLWDGIASEAGSSLAVAPDQVAELKRRLDAHRGDPDAVIAWEQVRSELGD